MNRAPGSLIIRLVVILAAIAFSGCAGRHDSGITQVSTIDSLLAGVYDGHMSLGELRRHGDFGLGTYDRLDGEMILLDGIFYRAAADGKIVRPALSETTPFACVTGFSPGAKTPASRLDLRGLEAVIDRLAPVQNRFCAFRVHGVFTHVRVRSVPSQAHPYRPLAEVTKTQAVFDLKNVRGTLIGFRSPPFVKGLNVPGYHMHFLSDDHSAGGHILDAQISSAAIETDSKIDWLNVFLPRENEAFTKANLSIDRSRELHSVEQQSPSYR